jgi:hypothetical protein
MNRLRVPGQLIEPQLVRNEDVWRNFSSLCSKEAHKASDCEGLHKKTPLLPTKTRGLFLSTVRTRADE